MHFKTRSGHTTLQLQAVTLEARATGGLQSMLALSPVKVAMAAMCATKRTFSTDEGWCGTSRVCSTPGCSARGCRGTRIPQCGVSGSTLPGLAHLRMFPHGFLCNVWSAVNGYTLHCNLHINRTSAFYRNWTDPITVT